MLITEEMAWEAVRLVQDPEVGMSIVDMGLIYNIDLDKEAKKVDVTMTLTSQMCPVGPYIIQNVEEAVMMMPDVEDVSVEIVWDPPWDPHTMASDEVKDMLGIW